MVGLVVKATQGGPGTTSSESSDDASATSVANSFQSVSSTVPFNTFAATSTGSQIGLNGGA